MKGNVVGGTSGTCRSDEKWI